MNNQRTLSILKIILYVLAGLVLVLGLIIGISLLASASNVHNLLLPLQLMGAEVIVNIVAPMLAGLIRGLGWTALVISIVLSLLLYATGRLLGQIVSLETRLARLEGQPAR